MIDDKVYIAIAPCGCIHGVDFEDGPETHAQIVEWVKAGSRVERVAEDTLADIGGGPHDPKWGRV